jgi:predicted RNA methylase
LTVDSSQLTVELTSSQFQSFLEALEARHLADLRFSEVTRALRALSSAYVERRETALAGHKALDGAGKRAAFAMYYGPIHFLLVQHILRQLGHRFTPIGHRSISVVPDRGTVVDLGCGTGVAGAAVATLVTPPLKVVGIDTHPWTLDEARFTYQAFGLRSDVRRGDASRTRFPTDTSFVVAAFVVNELKEADRAVLLAQLKSARVPTLVVEPISNRISPWWPEWVAALGGRADEWKVRVDTPPLVTRLAKAAGLRPEVLTARSLLIT